MSQRTRWGCPDIATSDREYTKPVPGSEFTFEDCPAYYLRTANMGLPAEHLIDGVTHPGHIVGELAFEVESGARNVGTISPKARELVHLHLHEKHAREMNDAEMRRKK